MLTFTLAISCLTTSNLPWFMDLTFQVPMQYCSVQHWTLLLSPVTSTTGYSFCFGSIPSFFLELFLHWSPVAYWAPTDVRSSSFSILSFCLSYCSWRSQGKNTEVVCHSFLQWTTFCQTSPPWPAHLEWPHRAWLSFTELNQPVVCVIRLTSFLWLWFQCVCSLMPSCNTYHLTWVSLTLDMGCLFTAAPALPGWDITGAVERSYPCPRSGRRLGGATHAWGQGRRLRGATPCPRSGGCEGTGGWRGITPRSRSGGAVVRRHPSSKVRSSSCTLYINYISIKLLGGGRIVKLLCIPEKIWKISNL